MQFRRRRFGGGHSDNQWHRRAGLSRSLRFAIFIGPIAGSLLIATILSKVLPRASGALTAVLWVAVVACGSLLTLVIFERAARRFLPLAALLNISLLFPDKAPARFAVARKTGTPRQLQEQLTKARAAGHQDDAQGMQSVIELVLALSVHDKGTRGHSERVRVFADLIADELKIDEPSQARLRWAALLHDVGKLEVPKTLLNKPGAPDEEEWKVLHRHPEEGARLVAPLLPWLGDWGRAVVEHHERYDGTGYPHRLKAHEISLAARIVAVADTYEVMTAPRPYKRSMSVEAARQELTKVAGTQLDPAIVRAFLNISVGRLWRTIGFGAWIGQIPALGRLWGELGNIGSWIGAGALTVGPAIVIAVSGVGGPTPSPSPTGLLTSVGSTTPSTTATAHPSAGASGTPTQSTTPGSSSPTPEPSGLATPTAQGGGGVSGGASPTATTQPTSTPAPTPTATPPPTPSPSPTPDPWSCASCLNTSPSCTSHCNNNNLSLCTTYCEGNNNSVCTSHCFGNNNHSCLTYCAGPNNPHCQSNCRPNVQTARTQTFPSGMRLLAVFQIGALTPRGGAHPAMALGARSVIFALATT
ncbi:MAG TPA: HD-GYP domain-containing protein [Candidatus Dormibacteraeota bacterium]